MAQLILSPLQNTYLFIITKHQSRRSSMLELLRDWCFWILSPIAWRLQRCPFIRIFSKTQMPVAKSSFSYHLLETIQFIAKITKEYVISHSFSICCYRQTKNRV